MSHVLNDSSQSPSGALSAPPTRLIPSSTDFNILATMLQDIAQTLLKYGLPEPNAEVYANAEVKKSSQQEALEQMEQSEPSDQPEQRLHIIRYILIL